MIPIAAWKFSFTSTKTTCILRNYLGGGPSFNSTDSIAHPLWAVNPLKGFPEWTDLKLTDELKPSSITHFDLNKHPHEQSPTTRFL